MDYLSSTSAAFTQTVKTARTTASLMAAPNPSSFGETVKLTATVKSGTLPATGSVTFKNGTNTIGTGTLSASGVAALNVTTLPIGTDTLTVVYAGNTDFLGSTYPRTKRRNVGHPATVNRFDEFWNETK